MVRALQIKSPAQGLLLHHIYNKKRAPRSLSEISTTMLEQLCAIAQEESITLSTLENAHKKDHLPLTFDDGFTSIYTKALPVLEKYQIKASLFITTGHLSKQTVHDVYGNQTYLSKEQIQELHQKGFHIGSHTVTHRALTLLPDEEVYTELRESRRILEEIVKSPVTSLAFPLGLWNHRILAIAKSVGYKSFTVYNYHNKAKTASDITAVTALYPFDNEDDIREKVTEFRAWSNAKARAAIIPHFAKGSPLASFSKKYNPLYFFDNFNSLKKK